MSLSQKVIVLPPVLDILLQATGKRKIPERRRIGLTLADSHMKFITIGKSNWQLAAC